MQLGASSLVPHMGIILFSMNRAGAETSLDVEIFYVVLASVSMDFNLPIHCRFFSNLCVHVCFPGHWCLKLRMNTLIEKPTTFGLHYMKKLGCSFLPNFVWFLI